MGNRYLDDLIEEQKKKIKELLPQLELVDDKEVIYEAIGQITEIIFLLEGGQ